MRPQRQPRRRRRRVGRETEDVGPLLDRLAKILVVDECVGVAVEQLHARAMARVPGVHRANEIAPLLRGHDVVAAGARAAPVARRGPAVRPAPGGHPGKRDARLEDVRIHRQQGLREHGARRIARRVDAVGVRLVRGDRVLHHLRDRLRVAAAVVGQRLLRPDIPAFCRGRRVGGLREDHDEAVSVGRRDQAAPLRLTKHGRGAAAAKVPDHQDRRARGRPIRHVDVHADVAGDAALRPSWRPAAASRPARARSCTRKNESRAQQAATEVGKAA